MSTPTPGLLLHRWEGDAKERCRDCKVCAYVSDGGDIFRPFDEQECPTRLRGKLEEAYRGQSLFRAWVVGYQGLLLHGEVQSKFDAFCPTRPTLLKLVT